MGIKTKGFVAGVVIGAVLLTGGLYLAHPQLRTDALGAVALLAVLALIGELLGYLLSKSVAGSIAVIPYLAMVLTVGNWLAPIAVALTKAIAESRTKARTKAIFNTAQHALSAAVAVWVLRLLGGTPMLDLRAVPFIQVSTRTGAQALLAIWISSAVNGLLVSGVIAVSSGRKIFDVWRESFKTPLPFDLFFAPIIFLFAWVCASWGPIPAVVMWVPILGLRQVHKSKLELEQTNRELLELMVMVIEARDPYTSGHSRRVQHNSVIVARALGLSQSEIAKISQAALLHDIGKIYDKYVPILRKTEKLTPEEWQVMQQHPIDGSELIATMSGLKDIVGPIRHHHESWDGTGYPDGLAGDGIPLASRVIMFADTIDAMTSERPYRRPLQPEDVRKELIRCRGRQFDPAIADRLLASPLWPQLFGPHEAIRRPSKVLLLSKNVRSRSAS